MRVIGITLITSSRSNSHRMFQSTPPRGGRVKLTRPVSDMELALIEKYRITEFVFVRWVAPRKYAACQDDRGVIWHIHPEAVDKGGDK